MKKILLIGATGTIGSAIADRLAGSNEVIRVGNRRGDETVDLASRTAILELFRKIGAFDALVSAAGASRFGSAATASDEDFMVGIHNKLMGQVNLVRLAPGHITDGGSITLTTGLLARDPGPGTAPTALVNAGLEGFVRAAALDLAPRLRLNAVSPIFVTETAEKMGMPPAGTLSAVETAKAYQVALEGEMTGQVLDVRDYGQVAGKAE